MISRRKESEGVDKEECSNDIEKNKELVPRVVFFLPKGNSEKTVEKARKPLADTEIKLKRLSLEHKAKKVRILSSRSSQ